MRGLLFVLLSIFLTAMGPGNDTLAYHPSRKLKWEDFKGRPDFADRSKGAEIKVSIDLKVKKVSFWSGRTTYDAVAVMVKNTSWVKPPYKDAYSLAHEQLHFDIAHIYAETLEMELNNLSREKDQNEQVQILFNKYLQEMGDNQKLYDRETKGGNSQTKQKEWAEKVKKDLEIFQEQKD